MCCNLPFTIHLNSLGEGKCRTPLELVDWLITTSGYNPIPVKDVLKRFFELGYRPHKDIVTACIRHGVIQGCSYAEYLIAHTLYHIEVTRSIPYKVALRLVIAKDFLIGDCN